MYFISSKYVNNMPANNNNKQLVKKILLQKTSLEAKLSYSLSVDSLRYITGKVFSLFWKCLS